MTWLYLLGFIALTAFLIWSSGKLEAINERNEEQQRKEAEKRRIGSMREAKDPDRATI